MSRILSQHINLCKKINQGIIKSLHIKRSVILIQVIMHPVWFTTLQIIPIYYVYYVCGLHRDIIIIIVFSLYSIGIMNCLFTQVSMVICKNAC